MDMREAFESKREVPSGGGWSQSVSRYVLAYPEFVGDDEVEDEIRRYNEDFKVWSEAWFSSRENIEIVLPQRYSQNYDDLYVDDKNGDILDYEDTVKAIESLGLWVRTK